jgi:hypothetical protein
MKPADDRVVENVEVWSGKNRSDENFPVASPLIARKLREPIHRFYMFARNADDIADSPDLAPQAKLDRLDIMEDVLLGRRVDGSPSAAALRSSRVMQRSMSCMITAAIQRCRSGGMCWICTTRAMPVMRRRMRYVFRCRS